MKLPKFTAEASLGKPSKTYHGKYRYGNLSQSQGGVPAVVLPNQMEGMEDLAEDEMVDVEDEELDEEEENGEEA